jgi:hypothetical protein
MDSVFVAGSRALSKLNTPVKERLDNIVTRQLIVLVGDAYPGPLFTCDLLTASVNPGGQRCALARHTLREYSCRVGSTPRSVCI